MRKPDQEIRLLVHSSRPCDSASSSSACLKSIVGHLTSRMSLEDDRACMRGDLCRPSTATSRRLARCFLLAGAAWCSDDRYRRQRASSRSCDRALGDLHDLPHAETEFSTHLEANSTSSHARCVHQEYAPVAEQIHTSEGAKLMPSIILS